MKNSRVLLISQRISLWLAQFVGQIHSTILQIISYTLSCDISEIFQAMKKKHPKNDLFKFSFHIFEPAIFVLTYKRFEIGSIFDVNKLAYSVSFHLIPFYGLYHIYFGFKRHFIYPYPLICKFTKICHFYDNHLEKHYFNTKMCTVG